MNAIQPEARPARKSRFHFWQCFWLGFLVVSLAYAWYCFYVPANDIAWAENYDAAQSKAVDTDRPMVLYFTGTWCVPCRIMKRQVWADQAVKSKVNADFIPVAVDVGAPENSAILERYQVTGAPVVIVTDPQGNALDWRAGGIGKAEFLELLQSSTSAP